LGKYRIPYLEGMDETLGVVAGNAAAARIARNVSTDHGRLCSAAGLGTYISTAVPNNLGNVESVYVFCEMDEDDRTEYVIVGTSTKVLVWKNSQWKTLFTGTAGGWGFLSYKTEDDTVLIFGNGVDNVQVWDGESNASTALTGAPAKGKYFALHYERVWMCGDSENPDRLYYSRMLNPNNWTGDATTPEIGGGFVDLPTFDGGVITNLYSVGGDLCILKSTTALLLYGTSPENYQVTEMNGGLGTIAGRTAAVFGQTGYFLTAQGIGVQSGTSIALLDDRKLPRLFDASFAEDTGEGLSASFGGCACGICFGQRLWFSLPQGTATANTAVLEYDLMRETYVLHDDRKVLCFAKSGQMKEKLLALCDDRKVRVYGEGTSSGAQWTTPYFDFGTNDEKTLCAIELYGEMHREGGLPCVLVTVTSDRGTKTRRLTARNGEETLFKRKFRLGGRRFKVDISAETGTSFCFTGGIGLETE